MPPKRCGTHATLPGATELSYAGSPGNFSDAIQTRFDADLQRLTKGDRTQTLVFYCQGAVCWEAYNAALERIPEPKEKYDPWGVARPADPAKKPK